MPHALRSCIFPGCGSVQGTRLVTLFKFPRDDRQKKLWIDFVTRDHEDVRFTSNSRLCSCHFTPDSFTNYFETQLGFMDSRLVLVRGALPTVSLPDPPPDIAAPDRKSSKGDGGITPPPCPSEETLPTLEKGCQCHCVTYRSVGKRTVATQLSKTTLVPRKHVGSLATVTNKSVAVGCTTSPFLPLHSSTLLKRKAAPPEDPPRKRPVF